MHNRRKADICFDILSEAPPGGRPPKDPAQLERLLKLTEQLIDSYGARNLAIDPFQEIRQRSVPVHTALWSNTLTGACVLVTGASGCIGRRLVAELLKCDVRRIVAVDRLSPRRVMAWWGADRRVKPWVLDIRDFTALYTCFKRTRPQIVFHLAAERRPHYAAMAVREAVETNIFGTANILALCQEFAVGVSALASTGKCYSFLPSEVYAATKKVNEWQLAGAARRSGMLASLARFTHVVENSLVASEVEAHLRQGLLSLHAPERFVYCQSAHEAVVLLLETAAMAARYEPTGLVLTQLGWPVDTLALALHCMVRTGRIVPLYFSGLPAGYERAVFWGQYDWALEHAHPLLNCIESAGAADVLAGQSIRFLPLVPRSEEAEQGVEELSAIGKDRSPEGESNMRRRLDDMVTKGAVDALSHAGVDVLRAVLRRGPSGRGLPSEESGESDHAAIHDVLLAALGAADRHLVVADRSRGGGALR